ncbi:MAG: YggT family protein [Immundisolibacter sp.]|uniref:YggT family protein n=1 Tax=Immundisolibacter sp. TaxID=1934948 RepID=UPI003D12255B
MVYSPLTQAALFLVQTAFGLYAAVVLLRLLFQAMDVDFRNPLSQFVYKATQPLVAPLRRVLPWRARIEPALVVVLLLVHLIEVYVLSAIRGYVPGLAGAVLMATAQALALLALTLSAVLIVRAIASWVVASGGGYNPMLRLLDELTEPLLAPLRRIIPPTGGFDWSVLIALVLIQLANILLVQPFIVLAARIMVQGL